MKGVYTTAENYVSRGEELIEDHLVIPMHSGVELSFDKFNGCCFVATTRGGGGPMYTVLYE